MKQFLTLLLTLCSLQIFAQENQVMVAAGWSQRFHPGYEIGLRYERNFNNIVLGGGAHVSGRRITTTENLFATSFFGTGGYNFVLENVELTPFVNVGYSFLNATARTPDEGRGVYLGGGANILYPLSEQFGLLGTLRYDFTWVRPYAQQRSQSVSDDEFLGYNFTTLFFGIGIGYKL